MTLMAVDEEAVRAERDAHRDAIPVRPEACPRCGIGDQLTRHHDRYRCGHCDRPFDGTPNEWLRLAPHREKAIDDRRADEIYNEFPPETRDAIRARALATVEPNPLRAPLEPLVRIAIRQIVLQEDADA